MSEINNLIDKPLPDTEATFPGNLFAKRSWRESFDIIFKRYMCVQKSEQVSDEVKGLLDDFICNAFNESNINLTNPYLIKTALLLLLDDLSDVRTTVLYEGLRTVLSSISIDESVFEEMNDEPFFSESSSEIHSGIDLSELEVLAVLLSKKGYDSFEYENKNVRISLKKNDSPSPTLEVSVVADEVKAKPSEVYAT